jgi:hypothetical protein
MYTPFVSGVVEAVRVSVVFKDDCKNGEWAKYNIPDYVFGWREFSLLRNNLVKQGRCSYFADIFDTYTKFGCVESTNDLLRRNSLACNGV